MANELMRYIPREFKKLVVNIYDGERVYNEFTKKWNTMVVVEWENGTVSEFQNRAFMRECLKEFHMPYEYEA